MLGERPVVVFFEVTKACALSCKHCRAAARFRRDPSELTTEEAFKLIEELESFGPPLPTLVLTEGDPLEREDLLDLVRFSSQRGFRVAVAPAVTPRLTTPLMEEMKRAGAWGMAISLDFPDPSRHDSFRGSPGTFSASCRAIREAIRAGLTVQVNTVVWRDNLYDMPRIFQLVRELGAWAWEALPLLPMGRGRRLSELSPWEMESFLNFLYDSSRYGVKVHAAETPAFRRVRVERERGKGGREDSLYAKLRSELVDLCGPPGQSSTSSWRTRSGDGVLFVGADGSIMPSSFLPLAAGNVRTDSPCRLYRESPLFVSLRDPRNLKGACGSCSFKEICGGSRARAFLRTGDPLESDPSCLLVEESQRARERTDEGDPNRTYPGEG